MPGQSYMGIPRERIAWAPTIDAVACVACGECLEVCPNGVFVLNDVENRMDVGAPNNCVVLCDKCADFCSNEAISFPDKDEFRESPQATA